MKENELAQYEQFEIESGDAPEPENLHYQKKRKKFNPIINKKKILNYIYIFVIISLGIYLIFKISYTKSLSDQNQILQKELESLNKNENELLCKDKELLAQMNILKNECEKVSKEINKQIKIIEEIKNENDILIKGVNQKQEKIKEFERNINDTKIEFSKIIMKENSLRDKIRVYDNLITYFKSKIEEFK